MSGPNVGHGHVIKRPDGVVARCGGPRICPECARDLAHQQGQKGDRPTDHTAAIAEAAREIVAVINAAEAAGNANPPMGDAARIRWHDRIVVAEQRLFAAVDAEREAQPSTRPNPQL